MLAYGEEPWLTECVASALHADGVTEVVLVDNGAPRAVADLRATRGVGDDVRLRILRPLTSDGAPTNLGFAGGCNLGARHATTYGPAGTLVFLNSDAYLEPDAVTHLAHALDDPTVGLVTSQLRLADRPDTVNSVGNPVQFLAFSWAGSYGEPVVRHSKPTTVGSVSGACFAVRRDTWNRLGGFDDRYFAYGEDLDLSVRAWQQGLTVRYEPRAVAYHHWHRPGRSDAKLYLRERNRIVNTLTLYERRTTVLVLPALLAVDAGVALTAVRGGWLPTKARTWRYVVEHRREIVARRREVQRRRTVPDAALHAVVRGPVDPPPDAEIAVPGIANRFLAAYWAWVGRLIGAYPPSHGPRRISRAAGTVPNSGVSGSTGIWLTSGRIPDSGSDILDEDAVDYAMDASGALAALRADER